MTMPARNFPTQGVPRRGPAGRVPRTVQATGPVTGGPVNDPPTTSNFGSAPARSFADVSQAVNAAVVAPPVGIPVTSPTGIPLPTPPRLLEPPPRPDTVATTMTDSVGYKKGGAVNSASRRGDGIAQRGKTKGTMR